MQAGNFVKKLPADNLWGIAKIIGAERQPFLLNRSSTISAIEAELIRGREVRLEDLETVSGLLAYEGRQVLLYIPDQGNKIEKVLAGDKDAGKKFHVAYCDVLENMKNSGRLERYIATTNVSGIFDLAGIDSYRKKVDGKASLYVCQVCLNMLNYKQAKVNKTAKRLRETFDLGEFFETYSSCFKHLPTRTKADTAAVTYTSDWQDISKKIRESVDWHCEECCIDLSSHRHLLHVHHKDGVKNNNNRSNLKAVCKACHRQQPFHQHMYVPREEMKLINSLRNKSDLFDGKWKTAYRFADPAVQGALGIAYAAGWEAPQIEHQIPSTQIVAEAAWVGRRFAISLEHPLPSVPGWRVVDLAGMAQIQM